MPPIRKSIRIVSADGQGRHASLSDAQTGEDLSALVSRAVVTVDASKMNTATVTLIRPEYDVVVDAEITTVAIDVNDRASLEQAIAALTQRLYLIMKEPPHAV
jgi:hypothetical protein